MTATFLTPAIILPKQGRWNRSAKLWRTLIFRPSSGPEISVPAGFMTDLASVPVWARPFVSNYEHDTVAAAIVHDWLYAIHITSRARADLIFFEALGASGAPAWKQYLMYWGVRLGGGQGWRRDRKAFLRQQLGEFSYEIRS